MMKPSVVTVFFCVISFLGVTQQNYYPIQKENLWGYIDDLGNEVIEPQFQQASYFSEGMAAVRVNGTFGFINMTGKLVIEPIYDNAFSFVHGRAKVYLGEKPFFIDTSGVILFQHNLKEIDFYGTHNYTVATTLSKKSVLINQKGEFITDTIFSEIDIRNHGIGIVKSLDEHLKVGMIDSTGKWLIVYDRYTDFSLNNINGYSTGQRVEQTIEESHKSKYDAVLDKKGKVLFLMNKSPYFLEYIFETFNDGLAVVSMHPEHWYEYDKYFGGVINLKGKVLYSNKNWKTITPFANRRAFVQEQNGNWKLIDTKGKFIGDASYLDVLNIPRLFCDTLGLFTNGIAWVKQANGWVKIDTNGTVCSAPKTFENISDSRLFRLGDFIIIGQDFSMNKLDTLYPYGFWNTKTNAYVSPIYDDIDFHDLLHAQLIHATKGGLSYYLNHNGETVWKEPETNLTHFTNLNIAFMNQCTFAVENSLFKKNVSPNEFAIDTSNMSMLNYFAKNRLQVIVYPDSLDTIYGHFNAQKVYVVNTTGQQQLFYTNQQNLTMKVQALTAFGEWKDIEFVNQPDYFEMNSNNQDISQLANYYYWVFKTPVYEGAFKTKLRIELKYIDPTIETSSYWDKPELTVYSNEYEGSVNPGQFWVK